MKEVLHVAAMGAIFLGGIVLFLLALMWLKDGNIRMAAGMGLMGLVAESNFYLHRRMMKEQKRGS